MHDAGPERVVIDVFPDYGATWPVWGPSGLIDPDSLPGLSPGLVAALHDWQEQWEGERGRPERYRSMTNAPGRQSELDRLARHLAAELRDVAVVRTDTWSSDGSVPPREAESRAMRRRGDEDG
ncbi:hypothetical protein WDZ16_02820 [Pseudokineococcus marinus]|uniref:Uncharacterized protein n=1 Tax=Pseudokineococcus marinus TaxID=351215 RepID=A0A849BSA7_9ACTN|nr:hypothetical protein [Pseudokineococcus marinus]NNH23712.1 hypothetical protein [Pseudokineococcus marinus]